MTLIALINMQIRRYHMTHFVLYVKGVQCHSEALTMDCSHLLESLGLTKHCSQAQVYIMMTAVI
jgi:hypothetical protein